MFLSLQFLSVGCVMFLASEVWRFYNTVFLVNTETVSTALDYNGGS